MVASQHYAWNFQVVTVPGVDTDLCVIVSTDTERYIIGAGENTQRSLDQSPVSHSRTSALIVGDGRGKGRNGLPGLIMRKLDETSDGLTVLGPPDLPHFMSTFRTSVYRYEQKLSLKPHPFDLPSGLSHVIHKGDHLTLHSIALKPTLSSSTVQPPNGSSTAPWNLSLPNLQSFLGRCVHAMFPQSQEPRPPNDETLRPLPLPMDQETLTDMVYIFQGADIVGKFDKDKALALKVPNSSIRGKLIAGETIEFPDPDAPGEMKIVRADEVVGKTMPGPSMIVVNCTPANLDALLASSAFDPYCCAESPPVVTMIHRTPGTVLADPRYRDWMARFGAKTKHLVADTARPTGDIIMRAGAWELLKLSILDEDLFTLPNFSSSTPASDLPPNTSHVTRNSWHNIHPSDFPMPSFERGDRPFPKTANGIEGAKRQYMAQGHFADAVSTARQAVRNDPRWDDEASFPGSDITVTTLGTGSAFPTKMRNVSSTHLDVPGLGGILMDAGEGTTGQLYRRFGPEGLTQVYKDLRVIFISHMHADHHLGLQSLLEDRFKHGVHSKLYLIGPPHIAASMAGSASWQFGVPQDALDNIVFISNFHMVKGRLPVINGSASDEESDEASPELPQTALPKSEAFVKGRHRWPSVDILEANAMSRMLSAQFAQEMCSNLGLAGFRTPRMRHRGVAWGLVMIHKSGWKVSYSGDTMPCADFIHAARKSTLMIHEATLDDEHEADALEKAHSTFSQAVNVGYQAKAQHLLLTHFSQRYPRVPLLRHGPSGNNAQPAIAIGFDLMRIKIKDMWRMQYYRNALEVMFEPEDDGASSTADTASRQRRQLSPSRFPGPPDPTSAKRGKKNKGGARPQTSTVKRSHSPLTSDSSKRSRTDMNTA